VFTDFQWGSLHLDQKSAYGQVASHSSLKCIVRRTTAREKRMADRQICANVFVNKGEGVVKDKDILFAA
jgi:hypothetical protein